MSVTLIRWMKLMEERNILCPPTRHRIPIIKMEKRPRLDVGSTIVGLDCIGVEDHASPFTSKPTRIIAVEGNIAAEKSTLINNIK